MEKIIKSGIQSLLCGITLLLLTACTSLGRVPLDTNQRPTIHQSKEILSTNQKNLELELMESTNLAATGGTTNLVVGGVLGSMYAAHENKQAEQLFKPLRQDLSDTHFEQLMNQQISHQLKSIKWLHLNEHNLMPELTNEQKINIANNATTVGDAVIYVDLSYKLSNGLNALKVVAHVEIYRKELPKAVLIYKNEFQYMDKLDTLKSRQDNVDIWSENNAARMRQTMNTAALMLSKEIAADIQDPVQHHKSKRPTNVWYTNVFLKGGGGSAYLKEIKGNKNVIRLKYGEIVILNDSLVERKYNWRE
ncbi:hypothetical protein [Legionella quateirensis]|uniref:Lipoprotein n=1 Tax=Legionella quateirensis TaxID=45072 RepID=A0A378KUJ5_9GAMM|nr:hypothetical protein [Legionella quateirensis]KTD53032.1 hypothetical protein Lqua_0865 [Legionella quateirensis]STY17177.1 Uncharacterised protein [Legionella quateirensis]